MDLSNKLKGIPKIYCLTLDQRSDRTEYAEKQYFQWGIKNYQLCSGSEYRLSTYENWKHEVILNPVEEFPQKNKHITELSITVCYLNIIKQWLENTDENHILIMEDDYDLSYVDYWHFDWEYLMNNIPYDWDCIQMSFENDLVIPCHLHPIEPGHGAGAFLINRRYAEKLMHLYRKDGKWDLSKKCRNLNWMRTPNITVDYLIGHGGKTYCIPLISVNPNIGSYSTNFLRTDRQDLIFTRKAYNKWWKELRDYCSIKKFFTYGHSSDIILRRQDFDI
jgi:hypothetical protein